MGGVAGDWGGLQRVFNDVGRCAGYNCGIMVEYFWILTSR